MKIGKMTEYPEQGSYLNRNVDVCFNYDTSKMFRGKVIRDDIKPPLLTVILLEDGRCVLSLECQYSLVD